jgi:hypothetical protein
MVGMLLPRCASGSPAEHVWRSEACAARTALANGGVVHLGSEGGLSH